MNPLRQLISQTAIYGLSSILGRFLNYLLVPLYTYTFSAGEYGVVSEFYAYAGFFAVVLIFGLETGYFRFRQKPEYTDQAVYNSTLGFLLLINLVFVAAVFYWQQALAAWLRYPDHPEYLLWFAGILALDAITALPFARLRAENRAWRFAGIRMAEIFITIALNLFFLLLCPKLLAWWPDSIPANVYDPQLGVGYIFLSNLLASGCKLLLLLPQFRGIPLQLDPRVLLPICRYSLPMVVIGFAGMINEMLDRAILKVMLPYDVPTNLKMLGIYGACYKLSILMSLFVQAFRYAGEPFFFSHAGRADAKRTYALVMQYFVIAGMFIFLLVMLYIDLFKYFIGEEFRAGLEVVPILLLANLCLGIYVNLSIWYKLSDRTGMGAWVSLAGAVITVALNVLWIPRWGYLGSAWATLACYGFMVGLSWLLGRIYYPVAYPLGKISGYIVLGLGLYFAHRYSLAEYHWNVWISGTLGLVVYLLVVVAFDIRPLMRRR
ncbi:polysaccharide biosynthesis C-terminal domain-containing protein [Methylomonas sp. LL1]|uniref:lipopolysaccharide biosynthesis protein n=1 Tax=Methylomonas sp. LL1 TaxID=2785785 RepID=UPI0018C35E61|nr:polysaccharide biosynthesis C-terminal domain-containing protein [Methylomonas sp. LL1]QPK62987.1 polysaccharide biosynthesis C-terminal domain-containing protein [Methylomonas sp. LL1]